MVHEVTIRRDTFLVTELSDPCDKINHLPLNVKLEKTTSPKTNYSVNGSRVEKTVRKKRKRKSLVEMMAQHMDQNILKSVIIAHAKQKCDFSSSLDSESDNDSEERGEEMSDIVNKIFRTVCTIDLCDDDDETLHEDVLQYLIDENELENVQNPVSVSPERVHKLEKSCLSHERQHQIPILKSLDKQPKIVTIEAKSGSLVKMNDTFSSVDGALLSKKSMENTPVSEEEDLSREFVTSSSVHVSSVSNECEEIAKESKLSEESVSDAARAERQSEIISTPSIGMETNNVETVDDIEMLNVAIDREVSDVLQTSNTSKSYEKHDTSVVKEPERSILKLRPIEEISSRDNEKNAENEILSKSRTPENILFEETTPKSDCILESKQIISTKSIQKVPESVDATEKNASENLIDTQIAIDAPQEKSQLHVMSIESETNTKIMKRPSDDKTGVNDSAVHAIIDKIGRDSDEPNLECISPIPVSYNEVLNGLSKVSRSRKRKSQASRIPAASAATATIETESSRKRPIFDYFNSPEILTTKRARKTKSYADDDIRNDDESSKIQSDTSTTKRVRRSKSYVDYEIPNEDVPLKTQSSNRRTSTSKTSKTSVETVEPKSESTVGSNVEEANHRINVPATELAEYTTQSKSLDSENLTESISKAGRGRKQLVVVPTNIAQNYVCGNCKEEVLGKTWAKHVRSHYGLAWRVDVDPSIVSL